MKKTIRFEWEGKTYAVEAERAGDRLTLVHSGKRYVVTLLPEQSAVKDSVPRSSAPTPAAAVSPSVPSPTSGMTPPPGPPPVPSSAALAAAPDSTGALSAPMTGVIKEIKVRPGHNVEKGQIVLIMEAMKMDIDVPSPASGVVAEVLVKLGDTVNAQQQLMVIH